MLELSLLSSKKSDTYGSAKQWAAVKTQWSLMKEPMQKWAFVLSNRLIWNEVNQGNCPSRAEFTKPLLFLSGSEIPQVFVL